MIMLHDAHFIAFDYVEWLSRAFMSNALNGEAPFALDTLFVMHADLPFFYKIASRFSEID